MSEDMTEEEREYMRKVIRRCHLTDGEKDSMTGDSRLIILSWLNGLVMGLLAGVVVS